MLFSPLWMEKSLSASNILCFRDWLSLCCRYFSFFFRARIYFVQLLHATRRFLYRLIMQLKLKLLLFSLLTTLLRAQVRHWYRQAFAIVIALWALNVQMSWYLFLKTAKMDAYKLNLNSRMASFISFSLTLLI